MEFFFKDLPELSLSKKYRHILQLLPSHILSKLGKIIWKANTSNTPYEKLRAALIAKSSECRTAKFERYFKSQVIGSQMPSDFLNKCRNDLGDFHMTSEVDDSTLREFFLSALPVHKQEILVALPKTTLEDLAAAADKIARLVKRPSDTFAITLHNTATLTFPTAHAPITPTWQTSVDPILSTIEALTTHIANMDARNSRPTKRESDCRRNFQNHDSPRPTYRQLSNSRNNDIHVCDFHTKFQRDARL